MVVRKSKDVKEIPLNMKIAFNDICMEEMNLGIDDNDRVYDETTMSLLLFREKYLRYVDEEYVRYRPDEIEFDMLSTARIMQFITGFYINWFASQNGINITSVYQYNNSDGTGCAAYSYLENNVVKTFSSDSYFNESVRLLNLICKMNGTAHFYDFNKFDLVVKMNV